MADHSPIEWTDATWNPVRGCSRVSPGCGGPNHQGGCYAERIAARFSAPGQAFHGFAERSVHGGHWTGKVALVDELLTLPLRWRRPRRIFVNSMSDLFHEAISDADIDKVFAIMALCPQHIFQVLTKRSARMRAYFAAPDRLASINGAIWALLGTPRGSKIHHGGKWRAALPLPNVWLGVSAEDQPRADERIPDLRATLATVHFVSCEPLLGPIDLRHHLEGEEEHGVDMSREVGSKVGACTGWLPPIDWVIAGGESGRGARPMHPDWPRALRDQCASASVPYFFKQWGKKAAGSELDGRLHREFPS